MSSETTMIAEKCCLQEWAAQIRDCQSRPAGMTVVSWCSCHGITKANYYYRLRRVREVCPETIQGEIFAQQIVPVQPGLLHKEPKECSAQPRVDISIKECSIHVTEETFLQLLASVLDVMRRAE